MNFILILTGGLYQTIYLTGESCFTLIVDTDDNMTSSLGTSGMDWLRKNLGHWGAIVVPIPIPVVIVYRDINLPPYLNVNVC